MKPDPTLATPGHDFCAADGWEERRGWSRAGTKPRSELSRIGFLVAAVLVILLSLRLAARLFVRSVGDLAPVSSSVAPRLD